MLITFSVENFKSIRDLQTLSLEASSDKHLAWSNVIGTGKYRLLKSVGIYGPNASGKSSVIEAMIWFRNFVQNSSKDTQQGEAINVIPFRLSTLTEHAPSYFEAEFLWEDMKYRYGFELDKDNIVSEWLFRKAPTSKEVRLFTRDAQTISPSQSSFKEGKGLEDKTRANALFLSVCAQFNGSISGSIMRWIQQFRYVSGLDESGFIAFTASRLQEKQCQVQILEMAQKADFNIQSLRSEISEPTEENLPAEIPSEVKQHLLRAKGINLVDIKSTHFKRDDGGNPVGKVEFDLDEDESEGTRKFIALSGPITHTLEEGSILIVDELEARLHPKLTQALVDLFHSPVNQNNAQIVFATHDVSLLDHNRFRRDQIWLCEKDETGATDLFSLAEFDATKVRANTPLGKHYMLGLFGAIPNLAHFQEAAAKAD